MSNEDTESPSVRDSFLRTLVYKTLGLAKEAPSLLPDRLLPLAKLLAAAPPHPETEAESYHNVCNLVTEIWTSYLRDVVQAKPPPPHLRMSPLKCNCSESHEVNGFLLDPGQSRYEFRAAEKRRKHIEYDVRSAHGEAVSCDTLRSGKPHALVITKRPDIPHTKKLQQWTDRASQTRKTLSECPQLVRHHILRPPFFTVLPEDSMRTIHGNLFGPSAALGYPEQPSQSTGTTLTPVSGTATSTVPEKRKASEDVVDLT